MITLKGEHIYLRALEPEDLSFVHEVENDTSLWELSDTQTPYSRFLIKQYLENAKKRVFEVKQLRLVICNYKDIAIGMIDLFDFDFKNNRAGVACVFALARCLKITSTAPIRYYLTKANDLEREIARAVEEKRRK